MIEIEVDNDPFERIRRNSRVGPLEIVSEESSSSDPFLSDKNSRKEISGSPVPLRDLEDDYLINLSGKSCSSGSYFDEVS